MIETQEQKNSNRKLAINMCIFYLFLGVLSIICGSKGAEIDARAKKIEIENEYFD